MNRRAALLSVSASVIWGSSFLLIRLAVRDISPAALVFGRTVLGAAVLVPVAVRTGAFHGLRRMLPPIVALTMLNMCLPIFLTAWAEQHIASSTTGILIATDPLFTALLALWLIRAEAVNGRQFGGLVLGFAGVVALLDLDFRAQVVALLGAAAVLLSAAGYAASALLYRRWLPNAPPLGVSALMMVCSSAVFALPAAANLPRHVPGETGLLALVTLGLVNTGLLSWVYFALVRAAGAAVTSLFTYIVPVVALVLGVSLLGESLTIGAIVGLVLIAFGTWLASSTRHPLLGRVPRTRSVHGRRHHGVAQNLTGLSDSWQASAMTTDAGAGLGLTIAKTFVEELNARIKVALRHHTAADDRHPSGIDVGDPRLDLVHYEASRQGRPLGAHPQRVRLPGLPRPQRWQGLYPADDPRERLGTRLR